jgi:hypothetical protein
MSQWSVFPDFGCLVLAHCHVIGNKSIAIPENLGID